MNKLSMPVAVRIHTKKVRELKNSKGIEPGGSQAAPSDKEINKDKSENQKLLWYEDWPNLVLVFDCETTIDETQRLMFGAFRVLSNTRLIYEGLFYNDDLPEGDLNILREYVKAHKEGDIDEEVKKPLNKLVLLSRSDFIKKVFNKVGYQCGGVIVGFNLPFDISRIAVGYDMPKKGTFKDGFIFHFKNYIDKDGNVQSDQYTSRVGVRAIDTKRSIIGFLNPKRDRSKKRHGHFVDLRTFTYALTGKPHTLNSACEAFGLGIGKLEVEGHGKITPHYIDYCRMDVYSTWRLYKRTNAEYRHHPIFVPPDRLYSAASLGKGYLQAMNVRLPDIRVNPDFGLDIEQINGLAMQSYYGGRVECRIRRISVPVIYCDFLSMYPTVNTLMGLWGFLTANEIQVSDATVEITSFIDLFKPDDLFNPETWKKLPVLVCIRPNGDFLPVRSSFSSSYFSIAWSYLHLEKEQPQGLWYTLAEVLGSKIITGKNPRILKAIRFTPVGVQVGMQPVRLNDVINVDPAIDDFFSRVIEERKRLDKNDDISLEDRKRLSLSLKILANSTSYGIFVELNPENVGKDVMVRVYSDCNFKTTAGWYEKPGRYFFPILGTFITSGAHLMLTLAQYEVERRGGVYAFMDTDSIAIVASQERSVVNGIDQKDQPFSIPVLPYSEVVDIVSKFKQLNPYDRSIIPGSVLKIEDENYPFKDGKRLGLDISRGQFFYATPEQMKDVEQLYCYAVSSKRYVLYNHIGDSLILRKASEHGLGMYLSPLTNDHTNEWIEKAWLIIASGLKIEYDDLIKKPALTRLTMTTPNLVRWTARYNQNVSGRDGYQKSIKPFSFLIHPVAEGFFNPQVERAPILVAPYANPETALMMGFVDLHEPEKAYRIHIDDDNSFFQSSNSQDGVLLQRVKSYADVLRQYPLRREAKLVTSDGMQCLRNSIGLLSHPSISISSIKYIGKETNMLDVRIAGLVPSEIEYLVVEPDEWETRLLPLLRSIPTHEVVEKTGLSRRQIIRLKQVKHHPRKETIEKIRIALINL